MKQGHYEDAQKSLMKSIALNPHWYTSQINLGVVYQNLGDIPSAQKQYEMVINTYQNPFAYANLITLYINSKDYLNAQTLLLEAQKRFPTFNRLDFLSIFLEYKRGNKESAIQKLKMLLGQDVLDRDIEEFVNQLSQHP
jgi:tetratricopeptide (TPR) repeat protein